MNKNMIHKASFCGGLIGALLLFACSENDYTAYCPTWKGFTYTVGSYPNYGQGTSGTATLHPGDSIHVTAHQDKLGHLINGTDYVWTICYDTLDTDNNLVHVTEQYPAQHTNYDGYNAGYDSKGNPVGPADPVCHMLLPANAEKTYSKPDTIFFVAHYTYSSGQGVTIVNNNAEVDASFNGRIVPKSGPTGGGAAGTFCFHVQ